MIREIVKAQHDKLVITIPKEYIGKDLEILIFSKDEVNKSKKLNKTNKLLEEFEKLTKNPVNIDSAINIVKLDEDINDAILWC